MLVKATIASALLAAVSAHQNMHEIFINDVSPGAEVGLRMPPSNSPVDDVTSPDMACNVGGSKVPTSVKTLSAAEGDSIKVRWDESGHPGPITHYLFGPVDDVSKEKGVGAGWFKIDELNSVGGKWANEEMMAHNMTHEFKLPTGLASGEYLLRSEMLALHAAQTKGGAQFYIGCAQLKIKGTGEKGGCGPTISIPGTYKADDKSILVPNFYNGFDMKSYKAPGGPVATCGKGAKVPAKAEAEEPKAEAEEPKTEAGEESAKRALPETFTIDTFVSWLEEKAGSA